MDRRAEKAERKEAKLKDVKGKGLTNNTFILHTSR